MRKSAGILLYKMMAKEMMVFLVHPGGPFWENKDLGAWTIPKGEYTDHEEPLAAAIREFSEETGMQLFGEFIPLSPIRQKAGKLVTAFALEGDIQADAIQSNTFKIQWPYKSGKWITVPEVDKAAWFDIETAKKKINPAQTALIEELISIVKNKDENKI